MKNRETRGIEIRIVKGVYVRWWLHDSDVWKKVKDIRMHHIIHEKTTGSTKMSRINKILTKYNNVNSYDVTKEQVNYKTLNIK